MGAARSPDASGIPPARTPRPRETKSPDRRRARTGTARRPRFARARSARRVRPAARSARTPRWAPRRAHVRRARPGSPPGSPPDVSLHRALDVRSLPEVGREVLPAAVCEHADDDALLELGGEPTSDVEDRP